MNTHIGKIVGAIFAGVLLIAGLTACDSEELQKREEKNKEVIVENSQEVKNLKEKIKRDEASAGKVGYVYIMTFGKFIGYYTITGKVSSNGSQLAPEDDVIDGCDNTGGIASGCGIVVDGPQDDNTYGEGDPGIFFFTTEGAMVVTNLDYLYSDQLIANSIDVPKLNAS